MNRWIWQNYYDDMTQQKKWQTTLFSSFVNLFGWRSYKRFIKLYERYFYFSNTVGRIKRIKCNPQVPVSAFFKNSARRFDASFAVNDQRGQRKSQNERGKLNFSHFAICYIHIESYSIVLRRFNNAIYFHNNSTPMLFKQCGGNASLHIFISPSHFLTLPFSLAPCVCAQLDNIIFCFYLSFG